MIRIFLKLLAVYFTLTVIIVLVGYKTMENKKDSELKLKNESVVFNVEKLLETSYDEIISDAKFIANQSQYILRNSSIDTRSFLAQTYIQFASSKKYFDQIRFIDANGNEQVRVNYHGQKASLVPADSLSNKKLRYYFKHTMRMNDGDVYISPLDLNIEHGEIEYPIKPMIRVGIPIFDGDNQKLGIVVVNYLAGYLIDQIKAMEEKLIGNILLINKWGYYLIGLNTSQEWAFMFNINSQCKLRNDFKDEYLDITENIKGNIESGKGKLSYGTVRFSDPNYYSLYYFSNEFSPNSSIKSLSDESYEYKIIAYCSKNEFSALVKNALKPFWMILLLSFIPIVVLLWFFAKFMEYKHASEHELELKRLKIRQSIKELESKNNLLYYKNKEVQKHVDKVSELNQKLASIKTELQVRDKQYNHLSHVNEEFSSMISKDLRGQFNSIFGISKLFANTKGRENLKKKESIVNLLKQSAENANQLLNRMTIWSKEEVSSLPFNPEPFDLKILVDDFVLLYTDEAEKKGVTLQSFIGVTTFVLADISMICIVLKKMINNAILYATKKGIITISMNRFQDPEYVELRIKISSVLKDLVKTDKQSEEIPDGSENLNFFICNELIKRHNNQIKVSDNSITGKKYSFLLKNWHPQQN